MKTVKLIDKYKEFFPLFFFSQIVCLIAIIVQRYYFFTIDVPINLLGTLFSQEVLYAQGFILLTLLPAVVLPRTFKRIYFSLIFTCLTFFVVSSWIGYSFFNRFFNLDTALMIYHDHQQLVAHLTQLSPIPLYTIPLTFPVIIILFIGIQVQTVHFHRIMGTIVLVVNGLLLLMYFWGYWLFNVSSERNETIEKINLTKHEAYTYYAKAHTGPFSSLANDTLSRLLERNIKLDLSGVEVIYDEIKFETRDETIENKPNVILILIESLRKDQLPIYGGQRDVMPNLEKLAQESLVYMNALGQSSHSSYADIVPLSSHYPLRDKFSHFYPSEPSYPRFMFQDLLKPQGYKTAVISSQNEYWGNMYNYISNENLDAFYHAQNFDGALKTVSEETNKWLEHAKLITGKVDDKDTITGLINWIDDNKSQPFAVYTNLQSSHYPFEVIDKEGIVFSSAELLSKHTKAQKGMMLVDAVNLYADSLNYIDRQLGRLFNKLKDDGVWENSIIIVSADTAFSFNENGLFGNGGPLDQEVISVPLIIKAPNMSHQKIEKRVRHLDILPTINQLVGLPISDSYQGKSMLSDFDATNEETFFVAQSPIAHEYAIIWKQWKLVLDKRRELYFLFNLNSDPLAHHNVLNDNTALAKELAYRLHVWINLQLDYYQDIDLHSRVYPPKIEFNRDEKLEK